MTIDQITGLISWNTTASNIGNSSVLMEVGDSRGGVTQQKYSLSVIDVPPNRPPVFTSTPVVDAAINTKYTYQAFAKDADDDYLTFSLLSAPQGMTIDSTTGMVTWQLQGNQVGSTPIELIVDDGNGGKAAQSFIILARPEPGNHAPVIISTPVTIATVSIGYVPTVASIYTYNVGSLDPDFDALTYTLVTAPTGMTIDSKLGLINWSLTPEDVGQHQVTVRVEDGHGGIDTQSFRLDAVASYSAQLRGSVFNDLNGDGQRFNTIGNSNAPVTVTDSSGSSITLSNNTTSLVVSGGLARNGLTSYGGYYTQTDLARNTRPTWSVDPVLRFPNGAVTVLSNANVSGAFGAPQHIGNGVVRNTSVTNGVSVQADTELVGSSPKTTFTFTASPGETLNGTTFVFYVENDIISVQNIASFTGSIAGEDLALFQYDSDARNFTVRLTGEADTGASLDLFGAGRWTGFGYAIETGDLGVLSPDGSNFVTSGDLGLALGFSLSGTSASLTINYDNQPTPPDPGLVRVVYLDDNRNGLRDSDEKFTTTDTRGNYAFSDLAPGSYMVVQEPQSGWVITTPTGGMHEVNVSSNQIVGGLDFGNVQQIGGEIRGVKFNDLNRDGIQGIDEKGLENWLIYLDDNQNGQRDTGERFTFTNSNGNYTFTNVRPGSYTVASELQPGWIVTEPINNIAVTVSSSQVVTGINFGNVVSDVAENQPPLFAGIDPGSGISNAPTTAKVGQLLRYDANAIDTDGNSLTYSLPVKPIGMIVDAATGVLVWQPTSEQLGIHDVILKVADGQGGVDLLFFQVNVALPNTKPIIISQPVSSTVAGRLYQYQVSAIDADSDLITYRLETAAAGMMFDTTTGLLTWTPTGAQIGSQFVTLTADDAKGGIISQGFTLNVLAVAGNQAPIITSTPRTNTYLGNSYFYAVKATDFDSDVLTYSIETAPTGMTIDNKGLIAWTPSSEQLGNNLILVKVSDGQGGAYIQPFTINVNNFALNHAPTITSTPNLVTNLERTYAYNLTSSDEDGDLLLWSLDSSPAGMVIDPQSGALRWQPRADQIGEHTVAVRLSDSWGSFVAQEFILNVTGVNTPSAIVSYPITRAAQNQLYTYTVIATDPENDPLTFSLGTKPAGMTIDNNGTIRWTPQANQIGSQQVEVFARDAQGAVTTQTFTVEVGTTAINHAPSITSTPVYLANVGSPYSYQVVATDPDAGDTLTYQLLSVPTGVTGITIDPTTGLLTWANPVAGNYKIVVGAVDAAGLGAAQGFTLTARVNNAPVIRSTPVLTATPGSTYAYDVIATDADSDRLTYSLDQTSRDLGMTLDALGRLRWTPTTGNVGNHHVVLTVSDGIVSSPQEYNLVVAADTEAPKVRLIANYDLVNLGESITFQARATDNTKVAGLQLLINGTAVVLDANGMARFTPTQAGTIIAKAIATDSAGNVGQATFDVAVIDTSDVSAPDVSLNLGAIAQGTVSATVDIKGTVNDDNLDYYTLLVAPIGSSDFKEIFRGTSTVNNDVLGKFDPSLLENDSYTLRLEAHDKGGNVSFVEDTVNVSGELKLGNFRLSFTDLSIPVTGIPITLTRTYDSLTSVSTDDFGYGWRMEFRDTDLRTSVGKPSGEVAELGGQNPFKDGTKVYITLPGGKREGFTFKPTIDPLSQYLRGAGGVDSDPNIYHPSFVADAGVTDTLTVQNTRIIHGAGTNQYYGLGGSAYNPADTYYGGVYTLTTKEGIVYQIDAATGDLLTVTDTNGNTLTYTDADITSSTGQKITFGRDAQGRIATVTDPAGKQIHYGYNVQGDLISVTDREGNTTQMEYDEQRSHYLDKIIDPLGRTGVKAEYDEVTGRLKEIVDVNGQKVEMSYDPNSSRQTVLDQLGHATVYEYDARGNILTEIDAEGQITKRKYDDNNYVLEETVISDRSGPNGFTTKYTYDSLGNQLTQEDPLGNITRYTYGDKSRLLTETDGLGRTTTNVYSRSGNLRSTTDALGHTTGYDYDLRGQVRSVKDANGNVTTFDYDDKGNVTSVTDALGNITTYTYNTNGNKLTETRQMTVANGQVRELLTISTYDENGRMKTMTDAENHTTTYEYDKLGHQTAVIDALQHRTEYKYDDKGQLVATIYADNTPDNPDDNLRETSRYDQAGRTIATIDKAGRETRFVYDDVGRLIETLNPDSTPNNWDDNTKTRTEYYSDGLVKAQIDERDNRIEFRYDAVGRQNQVIYADDTPATLTDNPKTTYTYDKVGQRIAETDALNHTTSYKYDDLGRLSKTEFNDKTFTTSEYDNLSRRIAMTDQNSKRTEYSYDVLGRLTGVKNALQDWTEYGYNEVGNLISQTDANQHTTSFEYDGVGRRTTTILPMSQRADMTYDAVGNLKTYTDFNHNTTTYKYDPMNWMTSKQFQDESKVTYTYTSVGLQDIITFVDANGQTTATYDYDYDERNRLVKRTDPDGHKIEYTYDAASNRTSVTTASGTVNYTFDVRNRLDQVIEGGIVTADYDYDAVSNLVRTTLANGTQEIRSYDDLNRLKYLENHKGDTILSSYSYTLDKVGNRTKVVEHDGSTVDYTYDDLYRLTEEKITDAVNGDRIYGYTYDKVGNRKTKSENVNSSTTVTNYSYDANDRVLNETVNQQVVANYTYDYNGNTLTKTENSITTEYTWDYENRLIAAIVKDANGVTQQSMQYRYNDNGIRVVSTVNGVETRYLIDHVQPYAQVLEEYSVDGAVQVEYVYGNDLIAQEQGNSRTSYHVDGLGSTRMLTDEQGTVVSTYDYEAYGELISSTGGVDNKYLFAGEQFDEALGDYYNRARYYDVETGRFTRRDDRVSHTMSIRLFHSQQVLYFF